jgi:hypothetical protein
MHVVHPGPNVVGEALVVVELKINTTLMQQNNFQEGARINEEQVGSTNYVCIDALTIEDKPPTLAKGRYSFQKRKCPILDKHPTKKVHT